MNNCPLCKSPVTFLGFTSVECSGRGCENFKGAIDSDEWVTREWVLDLFSRIGVGMNSTWYHEDATSLLFSRPNKCLKIHGLSHPELEIFLEGPLVPTPKSVRGWMEQHYPQWVQYL